MTTMPTEAEIYGIKNCDTVKKALNFLIQHQIPYRFVDIKKSLTLELLEKFNTQLELNKLINRQSSTWRALDDSIKQKLSQPTMECFNIILQYPTLLKRPVLVYGDKIINGFSETSYQAIIL